MDLMFPPAPPPPPEPDTRGLLCRIFDIVMEEYIFPLPPYVHPPEVEGLPYELKMAAYDGYFAAVHKYYPHLKHD